MRRLASTLSFLLPLDLPLPSSCCAYVGNRNPCHSCLSQLFPVALGSWSYSPRANPCAQTLGSVSVSTVLNNICCGCGSIGGLKFCRLNVCIFRQVVKVPRVVRLNENAKPTFEPASALRVPVAGVPCSRGVWGWSENVRTCKLRSPLGEPEIDKPSWRLRTTQ